MTKKAIESETFIPISAVPEIDFFQIPEDKLQAHCFDVVKNIVPSTDQYITPALVKTMGLDLNETETVVFNLPTNTGKTEVFYKLIKEYADAGGYLVLVCSPFIKLVEKDFEELTTRGVDAMNYMHLGFTEKEVNQQSLKDVHVMTINCLLRNPGENNYDQNAAKSMYMMKLFLSTLFKKRKIIIFLDEIHETMSNFSTKLLPYLYFWSEPLHKVYVSSATHTVSSYSIIKHLGRLTEGKINIFERSRSNVNKKPADLFIHLIEQPYSSKNLDGLLPLLDVIRASPKSSLINILVAQKRLVDKLLEDTEGNEFFPLLRNFNVTTGDTNNKFDNKQNNIGTTFKTGVNIDEPDNVFIIVLPYFANREYKPSLNEYGIFRDGAPAIIQALGRQRSGGITHIFMSKPSRTISGTTLQNKKDRSHNLFPVGEPYQTQNVLLDNQIKRYKKNKAALMRPLSLISGNPKNSKIRGVTSNFPSIQDYLIGEGQTLLTNNHLSAGQGLSSYVLWAATNNQLCNVKLAEVKHYYVKQSVLRLDASDHKKNYQALLNLFPELQTIVDTTTLHSSYQGMIDHVFDSKKHPCDITVSTAQNNYTLKTAKTNQEIKRILLYAVMSAKFQGSSLKSIKKATGETTDFERSYINTMISNVGSSVLSKELNKFYTELGKWRDEFYQLILSNSLPTTTRSSKKIIPNVLDKSGAKALKEAFTNSFVGLTTEIAKRDPVFMSKAASITDLTTLTTSADLSEEVYDLGRKLFTKISSDTKRKVRVNNLEVNLMVIPTDWMWDAKDNLF